MADPALANGPFKAPNWVDNIDRALSFSPQFVLYGNVRDLQCGPSPDGPWELSVAMCLWQLLESRGYRYMLVYNPSGDLRLLPLAMADEVIRALPVLEGCATSLARGEPGRLPRDRLTELIGAVQTSPLRGALVIESASRLAATIEPLSGPDLQFYAECERLLHAAQAHPTDQGLQFNPVFWLVDRQGDLPAWLAAAGERSRAISLPLPDEEVRTYFAYRHGRRVARDLSTEDLPAATRPFARLSEGLTLGEMAAVAQIAIDQSIPLARIGDAIRAYKVGKTEDPWRKRTVRDNLRDGEAIIRRRLKGQDWAVGKTLDILKRAALGLSGAQAATSIGRPRGVLFFAGPTGVGKTQLAKAVGELVFGSPDDITRFDMADYTAEHSEARLVGAPPGFVGFDQGGELVNAVRERPFSVLLFDEIEKAHARILDKFLQVLEDGRLTDGRGDTVYFSETVIIFTSNLGISPRQGEARNSALHPGASYEQVREAVEQGIHNYFHNELGRPEILNRIGLGNIIVFNYIDPETAREIFRSNLKEIVAKVLDRTGVRLRVDAAVADLLEAHCCAPARLENGGRGVGAEMETCLINPLTRAMFDLDVQPGEELTVISASHGEGENAGVWTLELAASERGQP